MKKCLCCGELKDYSEVSEGVKIHGQKCIKCGEVFWSGNEMLRWEVMTGKLRTARKLGVLGDSLVIRVPKKIAEEENMKAGDYALFKKAKEGLLLKVVHAKPN